MQIQKATTILLITLFILAGAKTSLDIIQNNGKEIKLNTTAQTTRVVDGDTIRIKAKGRRDTVRLLGIDTPETGGNVNPQEYYKENTEKNQRCLKKIADEATKYLKTQVHRKQIQAIKDPKTSERGYYDRLLGYIELNEEDVSEKLLRKGYARVYNTTFTKKQKYLQIQEKSRQQGNGMWNENCGAENYR